MNTYRYHLVDPYWRETVDLRQYESEIASVVKQFPVSLDKVKSDYYQITIQNDTKKNKIVRELGRNIANNTSLKTYSRNKKGKKKSNELFVQIKPKKKA